MGKYRDTRDMRILDLKGDNIPLFYPYIPEEAINAVEATLRTRWIGQGPQVDAFEEEFKAALSLQSHPMAVGAGTDGLHLAYILAGLEAGDEVITPVFTCTATNIPLLYQKATIKFADIELDSMNIDPKHVRELVNERTKAIVCVHYGGLPCEMNELRVIADEWGIPIIEDAAQALGASYRGRPVGELSEFTIFSFQAIKCITTGDGGMLVLKDESRLAEARRRRWFGIDREAKQQGFWDNDIREVGYKYQMTDIAAAMGRAALQSLDDCLAHRRALMRSYLQGLDSVAGVTPLGHNKPDRVHASWLFTIAVDRRLDLERKLREQGIESGQVHFRNDRYSIFSEYRGTQLPQMDLLESRYLVLPLHTRMSEEDVGRICEVIKSGW